MNPRISPASYTTSRGRRIRFFARGGFGWGGFAWGGPAIPAWAVSVAVHGVLGLFVASAIHARSAAAPPVEAPVALIDAPELPPPSPPLVADQPPPPAGGATPPPAAAHVHAPAHEAASQRPASEPAAPAVPAVAAQAAVVSAAGAPPTFVMALPGPAFAAASEGGPHEHAHDHAVAGRAAVEDDDEIYDAAGVSVPATLASQPPPRYPAEARAAEIESDVPVDIVVDVTGHVVAATVAKHVGFGLDEAALESVKRTHFHPAQHHGHAVAVRMRWTMQFRLQ